MMKITDMANTDDGLLTFEATVHVSEADRLAGKVINFIAAEMPELSASHVAEVLNVAQWWVQLLAYKDFANKVSTNPEHTENSYWKDITP